MSPGLAARLRAETGALHRQAEQAGIMRELLAGRVHCAAYVALLRALVPVYLALEQGLAEHPAVVPLPLDGLARTPALADDLAHLHGPCWREELMPVAAGEAYAARIRRVARERPLLLAAHAYVRYLGDLSGGQALGRLVARGLGLTGGVGVAFYRFGIADLAGRKRAFRAGLDALPLAANEADQVLAEARAAFAANIEVFEAVAATPH
jgi:heme oxygenase (biliverdin-producing, ferredoxin)